MRSAGRDCGTEDARPQSLRSAALATRTAERIARQYFGDEIWVGSESPVPSVDVSVTRAVTELKL
jgi:hypothetical protein